MGNSHEKYTLQSKEMKLHINLSVHNVQKLKYKYLFVGHSLEVATFIIIFPVLLY